MSEPSEQDGTAVEQRGIDIQAIRGIFGMLTAFTACATVVAASPALPVAAVETAALGIVFIFALSLIEMSTSETMLSLIDRVESVFSGDTA